MFGKDFSEKKYINLTSKKFNSKTNYINFTINDWINSINPSLWHLESPSGGLMNCAFSKMNYEIKKMVIKLFKMLLV